MGTEGAPTAIAVMRDDAGVAMPLVPQPGADSFTLVDLTEPATSSEYPLGAVTVIQREPSLWVAVDYKRWDLDCRLSGTIVFAPIDDGALVENVGELARAFELAGQRDALRSAGNSRAAMEPARASEALFRSILGPEHRLTLNAETNIASLYWDLDEFSLARERNERAIPRIAAIARTGSPTRLACAPEPRPRPVGHGRARQRRDAAQGDRGTLSNAPASRRSASTGYADEPGHAGRRARAHRRGRADPVRRSRAPRAHARARPPANDGHPQQPCRYTSSTAGRADDALVQFSTRSSVTCAHWDHVIPRHCARATTGSLCSPAWSAAPRRSSSSARCLRCDARSSDRVIRKRCRVSTIWRAILAEAGAIAEAMSLQREVVEGYEATHGPLHYDTLKAQAALGGLEARSGATDAGLGRMRRAYAQAREALGGGDVTTLAVGARWPRRSERPVISFPRAPRSARSSRGWKPGAGRALPRVRSPHAVRALGFELQGARLPRARAGRCAGGLPPGRALEGARAGRDAGIAAR